MLLKNPFFFGLSIFVVLAVQVGISFFSVRSFLEGDLMLGFVCFFIVPLLALIVGIYFVWYRKQRKVTALK